MALPAGWVRNPDGKSYNNQTFTVNNVQYELVVNSETGNSQLYQKNITGNKEIASTDGGNNWKLTDVDRFLQTLPPGTTTKDKAPELFANTFTLKLNQNRANVINGVSTNTSSFTNTPGVNNVAMEGTGTKPISQPATPAGGLTGLVASLPSLISTISDPLAGADQLASQFTTEKEKELFRRFGPMIYPNDLLKDKQDVLKIDQYRYKAPQNEIFKTNKFDQIIKEGLTRGTDYQEESLGHVILPMPNKISDSNNVGWGGDSMNALNAAVASEIGSNMPGYAAGFGIGQAAGAAGAPISGSNIVSLAIIARLLQNFSNQNIKTAFGTGLVSTIAAAAGYEIPPESILSRGFGIIPHSNLELLFTGPQLRQFGFAYRLSPRNEDEAKTIRNIIRFFKQGMAAKKNNAGNNFFLGTPNVFRLKYTYDGKNEIEGVNRIKTCALTGFSVDYSPDGQWSSYEKGQPTSITMTMGFQELEPIYSNDYADTPNYKISENSVGF